jgi:hypothetical protein
MPVKILRKVKYILLLFPILVLAQHKSKRVVGIYTYSDKIFYCKLELKADSTFTYENSFLEGSTLSKGKWKIKNDTLLLADYEKPWEIAQVEEFFVDTLGDNSVIDIVIYNTDTNVSEDINIRNCWTLGRDPKSASIHYDRKTNQYLTEGFEIWINNECNNPKLSDKFGRIKISNIKIKSISFNYDSYSTKNTKSNYFILALTDDPIFYPPPTLPWNKWLLTDHTLTPMKCNIPLDSFKLKR